MRRSTMFVVLVMCCLFSLPSVAMAGDLKMPEELPEATPTGTVIFYLEISGCSCSQYSHFQLLWETKEGATVDVEGLQGLLYYADESGLLLCDCSHGDGEKYTSVITSIEPLENDRYSGFEITLKQKVWLTWDDISENLANVIDSNRWVMSAANFKVFE